MRRDRYINEVVNRVMREILTEAVVKVQLREVLNWIDVYNNTFYPNEKFEYEDNGDNGYMFTFKYNGKKAETVWAHFPHKKIKTMNPGTLTHIKLALNNLGWFKIPEQFFYFPWKTPDNPGWGLVPGGIRPDPKLMREFEANKAKYERDIKEREEILSANNKYQDANVGKLGSYDLYLMTIIGDDEEWGETELYNICRSSSDRRPLLPKWYNGFDYTDDGRPCVVELLPKSKFNNYYPINSDGTLDKVIQENKKRYGKRRLY